MMPIAIRIGAFLIGISFASILAAQPVITDHTTPGGLSFRYAHMPEAEEQSIQFGWRDGYAIALKTGQGLAVTGPALVMAGPKGVPRAEYVEDVKDLNASMSLGSTLSVTSGGLTARANKFDDSVELFARVLRDPALNAGRLSELQSQYLSRARQRASNPSTMGNYASAHLVFPEGVLRNWQTSAPVLFEGVSVESINAWRKAVLVRDGLMIAAAGNASPEQAAVQIDKLFAGLPQKGESFDRLELNGQHSDKTVVQEAKVPQTYLLVGTWSGFRPGSNLIYGQFAARILRERLFRSIREKLGATYGASVQLVPAIPEPFVFSLAASVANDQAPEALAALKTELQLLLDKGVTSEELEPEKSKFASEMRESFRHPASVAAQLRNAMLTNRPADLVQTTLARISAVTAEAVNAAIRTHLSDRKFSTIIVAPSAAPFKADCVVQSASEAANCK